MWAGIINKQGKITKIPLELYEETVTVPSGRIYKRYFITDNEWMDIKVSGCIGVEYAQSRDYIVYTSPERNEVVSFLEGIQSAFMMTGKIMSDFIGAYSAGQYGWNCTISRESMMVLPKVKEIDEDDEY